LLLNRSVSRSLLTFFFCIPQPLVGGGGYRDGSGAHLTCQGHVRCRQGEHAGVCVPNVFLI
jgi:hypothetical protein